MLRATEIINVNNSCSVSQSNSQVILHIVNDWKELQLMALNASAKNDSHATYIEFIHVKTADGTQRFIQHGQANDSK